MVVVVVIVVVGEGGGSAKGWRIGGFHRTPWSAKNVAARYITTTIIAPHLNLSHIPFEYQAEVSSNPSIKSCKRPYKALLTTTPFSKATQFVLSNAPFLFFPKAGLVRLEVSGELLVNR